MNKEYIIAIAREAGLLSEDEAWVSLHQEAMERFAALLEAKVRADEREACAHIVEDWDSDLACPREVADAIRARGEK